MSETTKRSLSSCNLVTAVKNGIGSVVMETAIFWISLTLTVARMGKVKLQAYLQILGDQVNPLMPALFPNGEVIFQNDNVPIYTATVIKKNREVKYNV